MIYVLACIGLFVVVSLGIGIAISAPKYQGAVSDHFNGRNFVNIGGIKAKGFKDLVKWGLNRKPGPWREVSNTSSTLPAARVLGSHAVITFVNHSTFLIQVSGVNILTDPVWSERVSPFTFLGPRRMRNPGIKFQDLPPIDVVILSHNHYDHLDIATLKKLEEIHQPQIYTPLGISAYLNKEGISNSTDMDWWDTLALANEINLHAVPAQHFSGRGILDTDATLWCGYVLEFAGSHLYFAGDTGYGDFVKDISKKFQPMNLALLPIGAYLPMWFMSPIHTSPKEAVMMHQDLKALQSIGIHFGTFPLADDGMEQPIIDLNKALQELNVPALQFTTLAEGEAHHMK